MDISGFWFTNKKVKVQGEGRSSQSSKCARNKNLKLGKNEELLYHDDESPAIP